MKTLGLKFLNIFLAVNIVLSNFYPLFTPVYAAVDAGTGGGGYVAQESSCDPNDPYCYSQPPTLPPISCEARKLEDCKRQDCDWSRRGGYGEFVCIDVWQREDCSTYEDPGSPTGRACSEASDDWGTVNPPPPSSCFEAYQYPECDNTGAGWVHEVWLDCNGNYLIKNVHFQGEGCGYVPVSETPSCDNTCYPALADEVCLGSIFYNGCGNVCDGKKNCSLPSSSSCTPDCSNSQMYCSYDQFSDGCGRTCRGTGWCGDAPTVPEAPTCDNECYQAVKDEVCLGSIFYNDCGNVCYGEMKCSSTPASSCTPDCSDSYNYCIGNLYKDDGCGMQCAGTRDCVAEQEATEAEQRRLEEQAYEEAQAAQFRTYQEEQATIEAERQRLAQIAYEEEQAAQLRQYQEEQARQQALYEEAQKEQQAFAQAEEIAQQQADQLKYAAAEEKAYADSRAWQDAVSSGLDQQITSLPQNLAAGTLDQYLQTQDTANQLISGALNNISDPLTRMAQDREKRNLDIDLYNQEQEIRQALDAQSNLTEAQRIEALKDALNLSEATSNEEVKTLAKNALTAAGIKIEGDPANNFTVSIPEAGEKTAQEKAQLAQTLLCAGLATGSLTQNPLAPATDFFKGTYYTSPLDCATDNDQAKKAALDLVDNIGFNAATIYKDLGEFSKLFFEIETERDRLGLTQITKERYEAFWKENDPTGEVRAFYEQKTVQSGGVIYSPTYDILEARRTVLRKFSEDLEASTVDEIDYYLLDPTISPEKRAELEALKQKIIQRQAMADSLTIEIGSSAIMAAVGGEVIGAAGSLAAKTGSKIIPVGVKTASRDLLGEVTEGLSGAYDATIGRVGSWVDSWGRSTTPELADQTVNPNLMDTWFEGAAEVKPSLADDAAEALARQEYLVSTIDTADTKNTGLRSVFTFAGGAVEATKEVISDAVDTVASILPGSTQRAAQREAAKLLELDKIDQAVLAPVQVSVKEAAASFDTATKAVSDINLTTASKDDVISALQQADQALSTISKQTDEVIAAASTPEGAVISRVQTTMTEFELSVLEARAQVNRAINTIESSGEIPPNFSNVLSDVNHALNEADLNLSKTQTATQIAVTDQVLAREALVSSEPQTVVPSVPGRDIPSNIVADSIPLELRSSQFQMDGITNGGESLAVTYPGKEFRVLSTEGSSAVIFESVDDPSKVYKVYRQGLAEDFEYAAQEVSSIKSLSTEDLAPKLYEYKGVGDSSVPIIVMDKVDFSEDGFKRLTAVGLEEEINRTTAALRKLNLDPGDVEFVVNNKTGHVISVDSGGFRPLAANGLSYADEPLEKVVRDNIEGSYFTPFFKGLTEGANPKVIAASAKDELTKLGFSEKVIKEQTDYWNEIALQQTQSRKAFEAQSPGGGFFGGLADRVKSFFSDETGELNLGVLADRLNTVLGRNREVTAKLVSPEEARAISGRLTDVKNEKLHLGDQSVTVEYGYDPVNENEINGGLTYFIEPGQALGKDVKIYDNLGKVIDLQKATDPIPFKNIKSVVIDGTSYGVGRDAWLNPVLYADSSLEAVNPQFKNSLKTITNIWESAAKNPDKFDQVLRESLGPERYKEVTDVISYVKTHPEVQKAGLDIDPFELGELLRFNPQREKEVLDQALGRLGDFTREEFIRSDTYKTLESAIQKIAKDQPLTDEEALVVNVLKDRQRILGYSAQNRGLVQLTPLNENYALANLAEEHLLRDFVPNDAFDVHKGSYTEFAIIMGQRGVEVPLWFKPYLGTEFHYGVDIGGTKANAAGRYFISEELETAEGMARILTHERVHSLEGIADSLGGYKTASDGLKSREAFTDSLALLIKHSGDVDAALVENALSQSSYKTGVEELLKIVKEVNTQSGDDLLGTELLFKGITEQASGKITRNLEPLEKTYDSLVAVKNGQTFAQRMEPYSDSKQFLPIFQVPGEDALSKSNIQKVLRNLDRQELKALTPFDDAYIEATLDSISEHPAQLISIHTDDLNKAILEKIISDPAASKEMQALVDHYYLGYTKKLGEELARVESLQQPQLSESGSFLGNMLRGVQGLFTADFGGVILDQAVPFGSITRRFIAEETGTFSPGAILAKVGSIFQRDTITDGTPRVITHAADLTRAAVPEPYIVSSNYSNQTPELLERGAQLSAQIFPGKDPLYGSQILADILVSGATEAQILQKATQAQRIIEEIRNATYRTEGGFAIDFSRLSPEAKLAWDTLRYDGTSFTVNDYLMDKTVLALTQSMVRQAEGVEVVASMLTTVGQRAQGLISDAIDKGADPDTFANLNTQRLVDPNYVHVVSPDQMTAVYGSPVNGLYMADEAVLLQSGYEKAFTVVGHELLHKAQDMANPRADEELIQILGFDNARKLTEGLTVYGTNKLMTVEESMAEVIKFGVPFYEQTRAIDRIQMLIAENIRAANPELAYEEGIRRSLAIMSEAFAGGNYAKLAEAVGGWNTLKSILEKVPSVATSADSASVVITQVDLDLATVGVNAGLSAVQGVSVSRENVLGVSTKAESMSIIDYEKSVKKNLIRNILAKDGKIDSQSIRKIMEMDILKPKTVKSGEDYILTTGKAGSVEGVVEEGKYGVVVNSLPGIDIKVPEVIKVGKGSTVLVPLEVRKGSGKVEKGGKASLLSFRGLPEADRRNLDLRKIATSVEDSLLAMTGVRNLYLVKTVFADEEKTEKEPKVKLAIVSSDDEVLPWAGVRVTLTKLSGERKIEINPGWNLITLPFIPEKPLTASSILGEIALQGGYATTISVLNNGSWESFVLRGDKDYNLADFPLKLGQAYFIKALKKSTLTLKGERLINPLRVKLYSGWNAVGFPSSFLPNKASKFLDKIEEEKAIISQFDFGLWETFVKVKGEGYGKDFPVDNQRGYIIKVDKSLEFSP